MLRRSDDFDGQMFGGNEEGHLGYRQLSVAGASHQYDNYYILFIQMGTFL